MSDTVVIAGGGIGGLVMALTLHQIGVQAELDAAGLPVLEWALVGLNGKEVYSEKRGLQAGYKWPQYAVHRGGLHMLLYRKVIGRLGEDSVRLGTKVTGYERSGEYVTVHSRSTSGEQHKQNARLLIAADGIHSNIRAQMHPNQPPIHWGGAVMWRGTTRATPLRTQSSFIGLGTYRHRIVMYPISKPDAEGKSVINWIAEVTMDNDGAGSIKTGFALLKLQISYITLKSSNTNGSTYLQCCVRPTASMRTR